MFRYFIRNESGNVAITSAIAILTLLTGIGMAVDISNVLSHKESLQDINDMATLAAVNFTEDGDDKSAVNSDNSLAFFNTNKNLSQLKNKKYDITFGIDRVTGVATAEYPLFFANILPRATLPIRVRTVVSTGATQDNACLKALNQNAQFTFRLNSGARINAPNCELEVDSTATQAGVFNSGIQLNVDKVCVASKSISNNAGIGDVIETECDVTEDPYVNRFPVPAASCDFTATTYDNKNIRLKPGVYCGEFTFASQIEKVELDPGLYVLRDGNWVVNGGDWEGTGVTFYFMDESSGIQFNSGINARMTPSTSGPYANVFITEAPDLPPSNFALNDSDNFDFEGIVYLPSRLFIFNDGASVRTRSLSLVADRILINDAELNVLSLDNSADGSGINQAYIVE